MTTTSPAWKQELRATLVLAWPLIIAQLAQMALFTTDVIFMGWLGAEFLAAGTLATALIHPLLLFGIGTVSAVTPLIAQALGSEQPDDVRRTTRQGFWITLAASLFLVPILWQVEWILTAAGQQESLALHAEEFMHAAVWSIPFALLFIALRGFVSSHDKTRVILIITLCGVAFNALCNYLLVFGHFGFPRLELIGSGISTSLTNALMTIALLLYIIRHGKFRHYDLFSRFFQPDWARFREILRIGVPIGAMLTAEVGLFSVAALMMGWLGTAELAAHAITIQCAGIAFMIPLGLSQATTIRVGIAHGRQNREEVAHAGWVSIGLTLAVMSGTCLLFFVAPAPLLSAFLDASKPENEATFKLALSYIAVVAMFQLADGAQVVTAAVLRGMNDTAKPMWVAILGYWGVGIPTAYYFAFIADLRGLGIWYGLATGLVFVAIALLWRFIGRERFGLLRGY
ncbi:MAG: MATE family efflux transporter [Alphaproteobacteria bacterium]|nr:MATE family efflux transporter [Alphaproteobacteria bacterium]